MRSYKEYLQSFPKPTFAFEEHRFITTIKYVAEGVMFPFNKQSVFVVSPARVITILLHNSMCLGFPIETALPQKMITF